jgi:hypothetical protein
MGSDSRRCVSGAGGASDAGAGRCVRGCRRSEYERGRELNLHAEPSAQRWRCRTRAVCGAGVQGQQKTRTARSQTAQKWRGQSAGTETAGRTCSE